MSLDIHSVALLCWSNFVGKSKNKSSLKVYFIHSVIVHSFLQISIYNQCMKISEKALIALSVSLYALFFLAISLNTKFNLLGVPTMQPSFADLRLITSASECFQTEGWTMNSASCDPWGRPFNYPSLWVKIFAVLGVTQVNTNFIGSIEIVILSLSFFYWICRFRYSAMTKEGSSFPWLFILCFLLSPPILLLMERGNIDSLLFASMTLAAELLRRQSVVSAGVLVAFLGSLKLYPFGGILSILVVTQSKQKRILILIVSLISGLLLIGELRFISDRSLTSWNSLSYGIFLLPFIFFQKFGIPDSRFAAISLGLFILIFVTVFCKIVFSKYLDQVTALIRKNSEFEKYFIMFGVTFVTTYLMGTSYDYRLVITFPLFMTFYFSCQLRSEKLLVFFSALFVMYGGHLTFKITQGGMLLNCLGDAFLTLFCSLVSLVVIQLMRKRV